MSDHKPARVEFANTLRGLAALSVLITHYFGVFWTDRESVSQLTNAPLLSFKTQAVPSYISALHHFVLFNWGTFGVALFFLISGFVIPFSLLKLDWRAFAINRFFRLVPTYIVGFTITLLAIFLCSIYFNKTFPYQSKEMIVHYLPGLRDLFHYKSIDGIIWTLEIEVKFYIICALIARLFQAGSFKVFFIPIFLGISALCISALGPIQGIFFRLTFGYLFVSQYIIFMFIGVVFHYLYRKLMRIETAVFLISIFFLFFSFIRQGELFKTASTLTSSYAFGLLLFAFAFANPSFFRSNRLFDFLADISYPLYVIHGVAGYVSLRLLLETGFNPGISLLIVTSAVMLFSIIIHEYVELPAQILGKKLLNKRRDVSPKKSDLISDTAQSL